jgi:hypothetical protein
MALVTDIIIIIIYGWLLSQTLLLLLLLLLTSSLATGLFFFLLLLQLCQVVRFSTKTVYVLLIFAMHAVVSAHLIFIFNFMTLITNTREWEKCKIIKLLVL